MWVVICTKFKEVRSYVCCKYVYLVIVFLSIQADDKAQRHHARQDLVMSEGIVFPLIILVLLGSQEGSIFTLQL